MKSFRFSLNPCRRQIITLQHCRRYTRPSTAPKPVVDIRHIRQNPGLYESNCIDRNYKALSKNSWRILELFNEWQGSQAKTRKLRERNNVLKKEIGRAAGFGKAGDVQSQELEDLKHEGRRLKSELSDIEVRESALREELDALAVALPNLSSPHTPNGYSPEVVGHIGTHPDADPSSPKRTWRSHVDIGARLGILDFAGAAQTSGWGWYFLVDDGALLEHALVQYTLSVARARGWRVVSPPSVVYAHIAGACGFQPRDANGEMQIYALEQAGKNKGGDKPGLVLAGTAEIPLAGMKSNAVLNAAELPLKVVAASRCYRAEAGARGVETKGLYRVHEFTKVEMFAWTAPDSGAEHRAPLSSGTDSAHAGGGFFDTGGATTTRAQGDPPTASESDAVFAEMLSIQSHILAALGLHARVLEMPAHDLGASAARKRDLEAFFPSRRAAGKGDGGEGWGEVTSASVCGDYQARRLNTRFRGPGVAGFAHTLNGTALAVPRVIAAILENGWDEERACVRVPECLWPFMGGTKTIGPSKSEDSNS